MGFKDKMSEYYTKSYMQKYGDRMISFAGSVISVKIEEKSFLGFFNNRIIATLIVKPDSKAAVTKCVYNKRQWFKKPTFIPISQGHKVVIMGLKGVKGKENTEIVQLMNVCNLTNNQDLVPVDHSQFKKVRQKAGRR